MPSPSAFLTFYIVKRSKEVDQFVELREELQVPDSFPLKRIEKCRKALDHRRAFRQ
jgi:hypothetical protein